MKGAGRIVLTRQREANRAWADRLAACGVDHLELPLLRFEPLPAPAERDFGAYDWVLFTSPQGVRAFAALGPGLEDVKIGVLGDGTAAAVHDAGWQVAYNASTSDGAAFAAAFVAEIATPQDGPCRILMPGPRRRMTAPRETLAKAGHDVTELPLYVTGSMPAELIVAAEFAPEDVLFFCSPSAVRAFAAVRDDRPQCVAIGRTTADACREVGFTPAVAETPDLEAMVRAAGLEALPASEPATVETEPEP